MTNPSVSTNLTGVFARTTFTLVTTHTQVHRQRSINKQRPKRHGIPIEKDKQAKYTSL